MDRFERRLLAYRKANGMTVPAPTSASCETREHTDCGGKAVSVLTGRIDRCSCSCHKKPRGL